MYGALQCRDAVTDNMPNRLSLLLHAESLRHPNLRGYLKVGATLRTLLGLRLLLTPERQPFTGAMCR